MARFRNLRRFSRGFTIFLLAACGKSAWTQDGFLDITWANSGRELIDLTVGDDIGTTILPLPDDKLLLAGTCYLPVTPIVTLCATRLRSDGTYDTTFGPRQLGYVEFDEFPEDFPTDHEFQLAALVAAPDGRYLFVGRRDNNALLALLSRDGGTIDGVWVADSESSAAAAAYQPNGKIVVGGYSMGATGNLDFMVARFQSDLSVDTNFGDSGFALVAFDLGGPSGPDSDYLQTLLLQEDGRIVLLGEAEREDGSHSDFALARVMPNGQLDSTFGNGTGRVTFDVAPLDIARAGAIDHAGRILIGGFSDIEPVGVLRYKAVVGRVAVDGSLDPSFGDGGWQTVCCELGAATSDVLNALLIQSDGKILFAGNSSPGSTVLGTVGRLTSAGIADAHFGTNGVTTIDFTSELLGTSEANALCLCNGGAMVAGTARDENGASLFGIAKIGIDLILDSGFE